MVTTGPRGQGQVPRLPPCSASPSSRGRRGAPARSCQQCPWPLGAGLLQPLVTVTAVSERPSWAQVTRTTRLCLCDGARPGHGAVRCSGVRRAQGRGFLPGAPPAPPPTLQGRRRVPDVSPVPGTRAHHCGARTCAPPRELRAVSANARSPSQRDAWAVAPHQVAVSSLFPWGVSVTVRDDLATDPTEAARREAGGAHHVRWGPRTGSGSWRSDWAPASGRCSGTFSPDSCKLKGTCLVTVTGAGRVCPSGAQQQRRFPEFVWPPVAQHPGTPRAAVPLAAAPSPAPNAPSFSLGAPRRCPGVHGFCGLGRPVGSTGPSSASPQAERARPRAPALSPPTRRSDAICLVSVCFRPERERGCRRVLGAVTASASPVTFPRPSCSCARAAILSP